jgi:hypothetical protein
MAITNAQQAKQILMEDGGIPQLVKKGKGKKRPGYRGEAAAASDRAGGRNAGRSDTGSASGRGDGPARGGGGNTNRERGITQQYKGPRGTTGSITNVKDEGPKEYIGGQEFNLNPTTPEEQERKNFAISIEADKKRVADRKKRQKDLSFIENYLGPTGFTRRTKTSNLKDLGLIDRKFGNIPTIATGVLEAFDVPKETALFDTDSIREIYGPMSTLAGTTGVKQSQLDTLADLRQDMEIEQKILDGTLTNKEFLEYRDRNKLPERDDRGPQPIIPIIAQTPESQKKEEEEDPFQLALAFRADGGRVPYADGGIMDLESARQMLFLGGIAKSIGKAVKGATRAVKKIAKSPVGKIGLAAFLGPKILGAGIAGLGRFQAGGGLGGLFGGLKNMKFGTGLGLSLAGGALAGLLQSKGLKDENEDGLDDETGLDIEAILADPYGKGGLRGRYDYGSGLKDGGMPAEKGLMNLQGMEMDFREEGGFVPIGKKERADDVPARLSKNEFVMTADAVRGAGDGDIDKGAEKMYNLMDKLEAENDQSQGLDGARKMFKTAQRLEEVL